MVIRHQLGELKSSIRANGAQFVMINGTYMMPTWCVSSLASPKPFGLTVVPRTVRDPGPCGLVTWNAQEVSPTSTSVNTVDVEIIIVPIVEMSVFSAHIAPPRFV